MKEEREEGWNEGIWRKEGRKEGRPEAARYLYPQGRVKVRMGGREGRKERRGGI